MRRTAPYVIGLALRFSVEGLFHSGITGESSRAEVLELNAKIAGLVLPGAPIQQFLFESLRARQIGFDPAMAG